ncbi:MAG: hypothetical protein KGH84_01935 [Paracoccaceae bacterium]|nr:hypothetical protein [Paracoccaceae bacterium]
MKMALVLLACGAALAACSPVVTGNKSPCFGDQVMVGCYFKPLPRPAQMNFTGE